MLDLTMALQWVYDNIYAFNGNKDLITVYGPGIQQSLLESFHICVTSFSFFKFL